MYVQEAWPPLREQLDQRKDFPSWSAGCKDEQNILARDHDVSALDNVTLDQSDGTRMLDFRVFVLICWFKGFYNTVI